MRMPPRVSSKTFIRSESWPFPRLAACLSTLAMREISTPEIGMKIRANRVNFHEIPNMVTRYTKIMIGLLNSTTNDPMTENSISIKSLFMRLIKSPLRSLVKYDRLRPSSFS